MLTIHEVANVRRLLAARYSQRAVHRLTGVARGTIGRIASAACAEPTGRSVSDDAMLPPPRRGPIARCSTCGHRVYAPCLICRARDWSSRHASRVRKPAAAETAVPTLGLELRGEHRARYEAIRARRARAANRAA
jgi:hypothetical protein